MTVQGGEASGKRVVPGSTVEIRDLHVRRGTKQALTKVIAAIEKDLDDIHQQLDRIEEMIRKVSEDNAA